ncbi:MAG: WD40/YVTN/BNR-like repeat-containing protein [Candidatus Kapaibacterium sp.]
MKIILLPIFLIATNIYLCAQPQITSSFEIDKEVYDIVFRNDLEGYALTSDVVWGTTDAGTTWEVVVPLGFRPPLSAIALFEEKGLILGDQDGGFHITSDLNAGWLWIPPDEGGSIVAIEAIDRERWTAITDSTILSTIDGGTTFRKFRSPSNNASLFVALSITDDSLMYVAERMYGTWRSSDGGATWNAFGSPEFGFGFLYDIQFISPDTGFVASWYPWNLFTTFDGGKTWSPGPFEYPTSIAVTRDGIGAYTTPFYMRFSNDGGITWPDSLQYDETFPEELLGYEARQKVVITGSHSFFLLLSNPETGKSVVARIDKPSGLLEERGFVPGQLDLSQVSNYARQ